MSNIKLWRMQTLIGAILLLLQSSLYFTALYMDCPTKTVIFHVIFWSLWTIVAFSLWMRARSKAKKL